MKCLWKPSSRPARRLFLWLAAVAAMATAVPVNAAQIVLNSASVLGGSGSFPTDTWDTMSHLYPAQRVVSQQTGSISEAGPGSYWLGRDNGSGFLNEYFVLDLGQAYDLDQIEFFNTHNGGANDRHTRNFQLFASNSYGETPAPVPEPGTLVLLASGAAAALTRRIRRRNPGQARTETS